MSIVFSPVALPTTTAIEVIFLSIPEEAVTDPRRDGSYYYRNGDQSTYYNNGQGGSTYTAPNGNVYRK
jgi:hypothetical protein